MEHKLNPAEIILNSDGSVYHLNLLPGEVAETIITVGDPDRVEKVSRYFDQMELKKSKREFVTHTGYIGDKRISVISTGIGFGGIEIVLTEIDQLFHVDFNSRTFKNQAVSLEWVRLGTSGTISDHLQVGDVAVTEFCAGFSEFYQFYQGKTFKDLNAFHCHSDQALFQKLSRNTRDFKPANTLTLPGFYLPQARSIRPFVDNDEMIRQLRHLSVEGRSMHHLEMETAALLQLSALYGHKACSISAILADRIQQVFHPDPDEVVDKMIRKTLESICD